MFKRLAPLAPYLKRYWPSLALGGVSTVLYNVVKVLIPLVIGHAIDDMHSRYHRAKGDVSRAAAGGAGGAARGYFCT